MLTQAVQLQYWHYMRAYEQHFRFAERAQTDYGVSAVLNWAKEGNLGPEVQTLLWNYFGVSGPFHIGGCGRGAVEGGPASAQVVPGQGGCHHRWAECSSKGASTFFPFLRNQFEGALWMPLGSLERALRTDFPVHGRPHTFSLPTIYKVLPITNREWTKSKQFRSS